MARGTVGTCRTCGKQCYTSERAARKNARRLHPQEKFDYYQCTGGYWHYGHDRRKFRAEDAVVEGLTPKAIGQIAAMGRGVRERQGT